VRQHQPAGVQLGLEPAAVDARLGGDGHRDLVDLEDLVEAGDVDHDAAVDRQTPALRARAAAPGDDRHAVLVGEPDDVGDLLLGPRPYDDVGPGDRGAGRRGVQRGPVRVGDERVEALRRRRDGIVAKRADECLLHVGQGRGRRGRHRQCSLPNLAIT